MKIIEEFGINPFLLVAQIVNFTILLFLLKKFLYQPILKVLDERKSKIARSLKDAEEIEKKLAATAAEQEEILENARTEAAKLIAEAKKESKELAEKMLAETKAGIEDLLSRNQTRLSLEKEQMMSQVKKDLTELVIEATTMVSKKTMSQADDRKLVSETVKQLTDK